MFKHPEILLDPPEKVMSNVELCNSGRTLQNRELLCSVLFCVTGNFYYTKKQAGYSSCLELGCKDSNLEMLESESSALPFGDNPMFFVLSRVPHDMTYYITPTGILQALFRIFLQKISICANCLLGCKKAGIKHTNYTYPKEQILLLGGFGCVSGLGDDLMN